jgi:hypothetical protein
MRLVLTAAAVMVALVFIAVSAMMNFTFVSSLGKTPHEGQMFGAVSLASDAFKALLPLLLARAVRAGQRLQLVVGALMFTLFTGASFLSAVGFSSINRMAVTRAAETGGETLVANRREAAAIEARIAALPVHRPLTVVAEALAGAQQDRRWSFSKKCTDATEAKSREFCAAYFQLRVEQAAATEAVRLSEQRAVLLAASATMQDNGAGRDADPQATVVATVLAADKATVQRLLVLMIAVIVEIGSGFGLYVALGVKAEGRHPPRDEKLAMSSSAAMAVDRVETAMLPQEEITDPSSLSAKSEATEFAAEAELSTAPQHPPTQPILPSSMASMASMEQVTDTTRPAYRKPDVMRAILRRPVSSSIQSPPNGKDG